MRECVCACTRAHERMSVYGCVSDCVCVCVCESERESVCVCVWVHERVSV